MLAGNGVSPAVLPSLSNEDVDRVLRTIADPASESPFKPTPRVDARRVKGAALIEEVERNIRNGIPIVIENCLEAWAPTPEDAASDAALFSPRWLLENLKDAPVQLRNVCNNDDFDATMGTYLDYLAEKSPEERRKERNVLYGKDVSCPASWAERTMLRMPEHFVYKGSNDLVSLLPPDLQSENLMAYIGNEGTMTPGHTDLCGSVGQNIMVHAEANARAIWFMADSASLHKVNQFWKDHKQSIYQDNFFAPVELLETAPFDVYVVEQRLGDFVIVPPESAHQVYNKGGVNIKVSWNRVTVDSLSRCVRDVLSEYRIHMRPETYRIKALVHHTLLKFTQILAQEELPSGLDIDKFRADFRSVIESFAIIAQAEWIEGEPTVVPTLWDDVNEPHMRVCDFCRADIWNRGFSCKKCATGHGTKPRTPRPIAPGSAGDGRLDHGAATVATPTSSNPISSVDSRQSSPHQVDTIQPLEKQRDSSTLVPQDAESCCTPQQTSVSSATYVKEGGQHPESASSAATPGEKSQSDIIMERLRASLNGSTPAPSCHADANGVQSNGSGSMHLNIPHNGDHINGNISHASITKEKDDNVVAAESPLEPMQIDVDTSQAQTFAVLPEGIIHHHQPLPANDAGHLDDEFDICLDCYAQGRSCPHEKDMEFHEYISMRSLSTQLVTAIKALNSVSPPPEHISQEWIDSLLNGTSPRVPVATIAHEIWMARTERPLKSTLVNSGKACHNCRGSGIDSWMLVSDGCGAPYCARCLWHRNGERFVEVKQNRDWQCPRCRGTCNCINCLKSWDARKPVPFPRVSGELVFLSEQAHYLDYRHSNVLPSDKAYPTGPAYKHTFRVEPPPVEFTREIVGATRTKRRAPPEISLAPPPKRSKRSPAATPVFEATTEKSTRQKVIKTENLDNDGFATPKPVSSSKSHKKGAARPKSGGSTSALPTPTANRVKSKNSVIATPGSAPRASARSPSATGLDVSSTTRFSKDLTTLNVPRINLGTGTDSRSAEKSCRRLLLKETLDPAFCKDFFVECMAQTQENGALSGGMYLRSIYQAMTGSLPK
ncbi:hypothetical protein HKX48_005596 [Thoreauomyces humboldtii]|nr:hypothetical protein HKX48_005596 [Thoreauomyces humboldtii]